MLGCPVQEVPSPKAVGRRSDHGRGNCRSSSRLPPLRLVGARKPRLSGLLDNIPQPFSATHTAAGKWLREIETTVTVEVFLWRRAQTTLVSRAAAKAISTSSRTATKSMSEAESRWQKARFKTREEIMRKVLLGATVAALTSLCAFAAVAQTFNIRLAHGSPRGHPNYTHAEMLAQEIERVTNGRVKVAVFGDRQLGDDRDIIQLVRTGTVDAGYASSVNFPLILGKVSFDALQLPGLVKSYDDLGKTLMSEPATKMLDSLESDGLTGALFQ